MARQRPEIAACDQFFEAEDFLRFDRQACEFRVTAKEILDLFGPLFAFERAAEPERARLEAIFREPQPAAAHVDEAIAILERAGARDYTREAARRYRDEALAAIRAVDIVDARATARLEEIIVRVISA